MLQFVWKVTPKMILTHLVSGVHGGTVWSSYSVTHNRKSGKVVLGANLQYLTETVQLQ